MSGRAEKQSAYSEGFGVELNYGNSILISGIDADNLRTCTGLTLWIY